MVVPKENQLNYSICGPRRLTPDEISTLRREMATAEYMTGLTQRQWEQIPEVLVATSDVNGELVSILALVPMITSGWFELGPVYTCERYRGKQVMSRLLQEVQPLLEGRKIFITSHNPAFVHLVQKTPNFNDRTVYQETSLLKILRALPFGAKWYMLTSRVRPSLIKERNRKKKLGLVAKAPDYFWIKR